MAILLEATTIDGYKIWHEGNLQLEEYAPLHHEHGDQYVYAIENPVPIKFLTSTAEGLIQSTIYDYTSFSLSDHNHDLDYLKYGFSIIEPGVGENINVAERNDILKFKPSTLGESNIEITSDPNSNTIYFKSNHPYVEAATNTNNESSFIQNVTLDEYGHVVGIESSNVSNLVGGFTVDNFNGLPMVTTIDSTKSNKVLGINSDATEWVFYNALPDITSHDAYKKVIVDENSGNYVLSEYDVYGNIFLEIDEDGNIMPQQTGSEIGEILNPILQGLDPVADRGKILRFNYEGDGFDLQDAIGVGDSHFMINDNSDITPLPFGAEFAYISPPPIQPLDFGKVLRVRANETGYELTRLLPNILESDNNKVIVANSEDNNLKIVDFASVNEIQSGFDNLKPVTSYTIKQWPFKGIINISVGNNKDYLTLNDAINYLNSRPRLSSSIANINIADGYILTSQIIVDKIDLSWITICADSEITISRMHLTHSYKDASIIPAFAAINGGKLPNINAKFIMDESGSEVGKSGIYCDGGSSCIIMANCGIKNVAHIGVAAYNNSTIQMEDTNFSGSKGMAVFCNASRINMNNADVTCSETFGIRSWNGGYITATNADCRQNLLENTANDITIGTSSIILCSNSLGGLNQTPNVVTTHGIIVR